MEGNTIYYCRGCGTVFSGEKGLEEEPCPNCGENSLIDTKVSKEEYRAMTIKQQEYAKNAWQGDNTFTTKKCRKCGMNIPYVATKCPYCRSSQKKSKSLNVILRMILVLVLLYILGVIVNTCTNSSSGYSSSSTTKSLSNFDSAEQKAAKMTIDEFKESAISVSYDELKRNPNTYKGEFIVMKLYVVQIVTDKKWRAYTYGNSQWERYDSDQEFYLLDKRKTGTNIIEKDVITVYGVFKGTESVTRALTKTTDKIPAIDVFNLELNK